MAQATVQTGFWTTTQNNSGGIFDHDPDAGVGYAVCVEALDEADAVRRTQVVIDGYSASYDCPCCGDRWSIWFIDGDRAEEPSLYDEPLKGGWGIPSYIHYLDGRVEARAPEQSA